MRTTDIRRAGMARFICLLLLCGGTAPVSAQKLDASVSIGESARLWSEVLGEERRVLIQTPPHYERSGRRYPVVYLLDGEMHFQHAAGIVRFLSAPDNARIPEMIVVGVTNTVRARDLTPPTGDPLERQRLGDAGHADAFLKFLRGELIAWVDANYRTEPFRVLVGHSLGGLFAVHASLSAPRAFQGVIVVSPALRWNHGTTLDRARRELGSVGGPHFLFLCWGDNEPTMRDPTRELVQWLTEHPVTALRWTHRYYPGEGHNGTPHLAIYDGLTTLFADWPLPLERDDKDIDYELADVETRYATLSKQYGYTVQPPRAAIDAVAQSRLRRGDAKGALALLRRNAADYPEDFRTHRSLAVALDRTGCWEEALQAQQRALQAGTRTEYQNGSFAIEYQRSVAALRDKIASQPSRRTGAGAPCAAVSPET